MSTICAGGQLPGIDVALFTQAGAATCLLMVDDQRLLWSINYKLRECKSSRHQIWARFVNVAVLTQAEAAADEPMAI